MAQHNKQLVPQESAARYSSFHGHSLGFRAVIQIAVRTTLLISKVPSKSERMKTHINTLRLTVEETKMLVQIVG